MEAEEVFLGEPGTDGDVIYKIKQVVRVAGNSHSLYSHLLCQNPWTKGTRFLTLSQVGGHWQGLSGNEPAQLLKPRQLSSFVTMVFAELSPELPMAEERCSGSTACVQGVQGQDLLCFPLVRQGGGGGQGLQPLEALGPALLPAPSMPWDHSKRAGVEASLLRTSMGPTGWRRACCSFSASPLPQPPAVSIRGAGGLR